MNTDNIDNNMYIPEKDEFCWFISVNDSYELLQFVKLLPNNRYQAKTIHGGIYNYSMCEKFTGELPEHLKNILKQKKG